MELMRFPLTTQTTTNRNPRTDTSLNRLMRMKTKGRTIVVTRQHVESRSHLTVFARVQGRADRDEEGNNYGVSDEEDENDEGPYVPERWEIGDGKGDEVERTPNLACQSVRG